MSSKHRSSRWSSWSNRFPTRWSEWTWNEQYQRNARYREVSEGNWEWEYAEPAGTKKEVSYTPRDGSTLASASLPPLDESGLELEADLSRHYLHDEGLADITQGLAGTTIDSYAEGHQYPAEHQYPTEHQYPEGGQNQEYFESSKTDPGNSKGTEIKCPECSMTFPRSTELERHHKTVHLNNGVRPYECLVPGCPANVRSWTTMRGLHLHEKNWHGPHSCSVPGCSRRHPFGFSSEANLEIHQVEHSGSSNPDQHGDERRRGEKKKGHPDKWADTIDENDSFAAQHYASSQQESNFLDYGPLNQSINQSSIYGSVPQRNIVRANTNRERDKIDKEFVVHNSREFYFGRVFKVLWSEPVGSGGTEITVPTPYGERAFHKVRRFLIVSERNKGHSICIPILTYGNQGILKHGVHPEDHAVVYSSKRQGPYVLEPEKGLMTKPPIRVEIYNDSHKLDPMSRLNYAKLYTVEHNVKVLFIGKVAKNYERDVKFGYNEAHPPFQAGPPYREGSEGSFEDLTSFAEQDDPLGSFAASSKATAYESSPLHYQAAYPAYDDGYNAD